MGFNNDCVLLELQINITIALHPIPYYRIGARLLLDH